MDILKHISEAGVVGAGGAGFPTHVKLKAKADIVLANGAECEPLLRVDRMMMENNAELIIAGLEAAVAVTGAAKGVVCLKKKYKAAIHRMEEAIAGKQNLEIFLMDNYYPAGDEQQIVFDVTGKVVPTGGLPIDVGAVVSNVSTLMNIAQSLTGIPVTHKYLTVTGEVKKPVTLAAPIGLPMIKLIELAGVSGNLEDYAVIVGGPMMGYVENNLFAPVTKTTGGLILLKKDHPHIVRKTSSLEKDIIMARAVCCQCNYCTMMCPRNVLGLKVEPNKAMRAFAFNGKGIDYQNGIFSCCNCGICSYYACNFNLKPNAVMTALKEQLLKSGIKPEKKVAQPPASNADLIRTPVSRLIQRLNLEKYDVDAPLAEYKITADTVNIPLKMHIGAPATPVVQAGQHVRAGEKIASMAEGKLGAEIHASIDGTIKEITAAAITIQA
jgi:Na+-translocating ferredoxin:NAD+ oxidoreductase RnfC subunit